MARSSVRSTRRILGLDPGLQLTGYGVIEVVANRASIIDAGVLRLNNKSTIASRLVELERELTELIREHGPGEIAVEQLYSHYKHPRTAILMGHARGVILLCAARTGVEIAELAANRVKQSLTGHGHASKLQMQRAIQSVFQLPALPTPPDIADALAIALCQSRSK